MHDLCIVFSSVIARDFLGREILAGDLGRKGGVCDAPLWVQGKALVGTRQQSSQKRQGVSTLK